jgi:DNA end-binding protein Ku
MAPRANWKGYLRLSLVSCPIALYPASSLSEKVSFNRINRKTGHRLKQQNVDSETGEVVPREDTARGYEVGKDQYLIVEDQEIDAVQIESTRTIEIDQFVPRSEIDDRYIDSPYYIAPDGQVGQDAFAVIRDTIAKMNMVAIGRVVLTRREHVIALEAKGRGLVGLTLRYPYEVRDEKPYFEDIPDLKLPKEMLDLATHIVQTKAGHFDPSQFEDRYENALIDLLKKKEAGEKIEPAKAGPAPHVVNLMDALRARRRKRRHPHPVSRSVGLLKRRSAKSDSQRGTVKSCLSWTVQRSRPPSPLQGGLPA